MEGGLMNKLLVAGMTFGVLVAGPSRAADWAAKAPIYKAPPPVDSSWTGPYAGVALGTKRGDIDWTTTCLLDNTTGDRSANCPGAAAPVFTVDPSSPRNFDPAGFRAGGYIGYNWQFATKWLVGLEADLAGARAALTTIGIVGCSTDCGFPGFSPVNDSSSVRMLWDASVRGRIGFLPTPQWLVYATGGVAVQKVEAKLTCNAVTSPWCGEDQNQTLGKTLTGWTAGGGLEYKWGNWMLRGEYRYSAFERFQPIFFAGGLDEVRTDIKVRTHIATFGIAYLFNSGGSVVAKY
jgi:outer membrane immunogenic protein